MCSFNLHPATLMHRCGAPVTQMNGFYSRIRKFCISVALYSSIQRPAAVWGEVNARKCAASNRIEGAPRFCRVYV